MRTLRMLLPALLVGLVLPATVSAPATTVPPTPTLVGIRAAHHPGYDRIVFDFRNGVPAGVRVRFVDQLIGDPSGQPVRISGRGIVQVVFTPAKAHDASGPTAPERTQYALPNIMTAVRAGDFEGYTTYGIGLAKKTSFHMFTLRDPARVVIDVRAAFRTVQRPVWFFDVDNFVANHRPFFRSVQRPVPATAPGVGVLDRLFAGPLPSERANGLRLLRSGATGFTRLSIADQIARVHLTGTCSSGGSTVTVAGEIMPSLRAFDTVRWVKIYDQDGQTEQPTGQSDSIPECLEP